MTRYAHIARAVASKPWAIRRDSLEWAAIVDVLEARVSGQQWSDEEIQRRLAAGPQRTAVAARDNSDDAVIEVIPVHGVLMPRANIMMEFSGGASVGQLSAAFRAAVDDDRVKAIVLDIDSPGGMVDGIPEFGEQIRSARGTKPIYGVADPMAASAAYWIGSQVDDLAVTPSGEVGSIGVFTAHDDLSKFYEEFGLERTYITYGANKAQGNEFEPLSDHARERLQATIDYFGAMFDEAVAQGRGVSRATVRDTFGQGDMFPAEEALSLGMVDRIATLEETLDLASAEITGGSDRSARLASKPYAVAVPMPGPAEAEAMESDADPAVVAATHDSDDAAAQAELDALRDRIALRPYQRRQGRRERAG